MRAGHGVHERYDYRARDQQEDRTFAPTHRVETFLRLFITAKPISGCWKVSTHDLAYSGHLGVITFLIE